MIDPTLSFAIGTPLIVLSVFLISLRQHVTFPIVGRAVLLFTILLTGILGFSMILLHYWTGILLLLIITTPFNLITASVWLISEKRTLRKLLRTRAKAEEALKEGHWSEYKSLESLAKVYESNLRNVREVQGSRIIFPEQM